MNDEGKSARFAEIASELIGAKHLAEFVRDAWALASDDAKRELADAVFARITKLIASNDYTLRSAVDSAIGREAGKLADGIAATRKAEITQAVATAFECAFAPAVEATVRRALEEAVSEVRVKFWPNLNR